MTAQVLGLSAFGIALALLAVDIYRAPVSPTLVQRSDDSDVVMLPCGCFFKGQTFIADPGCLEHG